MVGKYRFLVFGRKGARPEMGPEEKNARFATVLHARLLCDVNDRRHFIVVPYQLAACRTRVYVITAQASYSTKEIKNYCLLFCRAPGEGITVPTTATSIGRVVLYVTLYTGRFIHRGPAAIIFIRKHFHRSKFDFDRFVKPFNTILFGIFSKRI